MTIKELEQLFKQKLGPTQAHPFNEGNWAAMEAMLDANTKGAFIPYWRQAAIIVGFGALTGLSLLMQPNVTTSPELQKPQNITTSPIPTEGQTNSFDLLQTEPQTLESIEAKEQFLGSGEENSISSNNSTTSKSGGIPSLASAYGSSQTKQVLGVTTAEKQRESIKLIDQLESQAFTFSANNILPSFSQGLKPITPFKAAPGIVPVDKSVLTRYQKRHEFYVTGGPSMNSSYASENGTGFNAGLGYRYRINSKMALTGEAVYNQTGDMGLLIETDSVFFGFGRTEVNTQKHYKNIGSLRFPVAFEYSLNPAHSLSAGAYLESVLTVSMDMTRTTETFKGDINTEKHSNNEQRPEFNTLNYGLQMAYFYQVYPQLSIGLRVNYGLSDLTNNEHQHFKHNHRLLQTDLTLRFRLF